MKKDFPLTFKSITFISFKYLLMKREKKQIHSIKNEKCDKRNLRRNNIL